MQFPPKNNTCAIMQPTYLPWLGYFDLIAQSKDFVFLDNVKFNKSSFHHQNKILSTNCAVLLSVPTHANKGRMDTLINEVRVDYSKNWKKKHLTSIEQSYRKAAYYDKIYPDVKRIISGNIQYLSELNIELIKLFSSILSLDVNFHVASHIDVSAKDRVEKLVELCQKLQCDTYYSPLGSLDYLDTVDNRSLFSSANIDVYFQHFETVPYSQRREGFESHMSILDALMHCGPEGVRRLISQGSHTIKFENIGSGNEDR